MGSLSLENEGQFDVGEISAKATETLVVDQARDWVVCLFVGWLRCLGELTLTFSALSTCSWTCWMELEEMETTSRCVYRVNAVAHWVPQSFLSSPASGWRSSRIRYRFFINVFLIMLALTCYRIWGYVVVWLVEKRSCGRQRLNNRSTQELFQRVERQKENERHNIWQKLVNHHKQGLREMNTEDQK